RERQHSCEQRLDPADVGVELVGVLTEPVEVQAVRIELAGSRGDECGWPGGRLELIERSMDGVEPLGREAVLVVAEIEGVEVLLVGEGRHWSLLRGWPAPDESERRSAQGRPACIRCPAGIRQ